MAEIQEIEVRYQRKRAQIEALFETADNEFAKGINALAEKQTPTIEEAEGEATKLHDSVLEAIQEDVAAMDQRAFDDLLIGYETLERQED